MLYSTAVMNLWGVVDIIASNRKFPKAQITSTSPNSSRCMQVVIAYRRKLQALLVVGL